MNIAEKVEYAKEAVQLYGTYEFSDIREVFEEDFLYWTEDHFKVLPNAVISSIPNILMKEIVPIQKRLGLKMRTSLANYMKIVRRRISHGAEDSTATIEDGKNTKIMITR